MQRFCDNKCHWPELLNFHKLFLRRTLVRLQHRSAKKPDGFFYCCVSYQCTKSATATQLHKEQKYGPKFSVINKLKWEEKFFQIHLSLQTLHEYTCRNIAAIATEGNLSLVRIRPTIKPNDLVSAIVIDSPASRFLI